MALTKRKVVVPLIVAVLVLGGLVLISIGGRIYASPGPSPAQRGAGVPRPSPGPRPDPPGLDGECDPDHEAELLAEYGSLTRTQLRAVKFELEQTYGDLIHDPLRKRYERGDYTVLEAGYRISSADVDGKIAGYFPQPEGRSDGMCRVVLPLEEFEALYGMKQRIDWMARRLEALGREELATKRESL